MTEAKLKGLDPISDNVPLPIVSRAPLQAAADFCIDLIKSTVPLEHQAITFQALGSTLLVVARYAQEAQTRLESPNDSP